MGPEEIIFLCPCLPNNEKMEVVEKWGRWRGGRSRSRPHRQFTTVPQDSQESLCGGRCGPRLSTVQYVSQFLLGLSLRGSFECCCSYFCPSSLKECFVFLQSLGKRSWWLQGHSQRAILKTGLSGATQVAAAGSYPGPAPCQQVCPLATTCPTALICSNHVSYFLYLLF